MSAPPWRRRLAPIFASQRCAICCWAFVLAVGMVTTLVVVVAIVVLESDMEAPLLSELRRLPAVSAFRHEGYEALKRSIYGEEE